MKHPFILSIILLAAGQARAQLLVDSLLTWQGYGRESSCHIQIFRSAPDEKRELIIVLAEIGENRGRSTFDDARHLVEVASRRFDVNPDSAYWIFHWGAFSFSGAEESRKEVFFRATFRRTPGGTVGPPSWRLVSRETVEQYTDRLFR